MAHGPSAGMPYWAGLILERLEHMALDISKLQAAVAQEQTVDASAVTLLTQLTAEIQSLIASSGNTVDPAALQALVDQINGASTSLAAAVTANTPANNTAPPATPAPTPSA